MKRIMGIILFFLCISVKAGTLSYQWTNEYINVPIGSDVISYAYLPEAKLYDGEILITNATFEYTRGVSGTTLSIVNTNVIGVYRVMYEVVATNYGNYKSTKNIYFNVADVTPPVLLTTDDLVVNVYDNITTAYDIIYYDNCDETIVVSVDLSFVDVNKVGEYNAIYTLTDKANNISTYIRKVIVVDQKKPIIYFGNSEWINVFDNSFNPLDNIIAYDNYDGIITSNITCDWNINNVNSLGSYHVTYFVSDSSGNIFSHIKTYYVKDIEKPVLLLKDYSLYLKYGEDYDLTSNIILFSDNYDLLNIMDVLIVGTYDKNKQGIQIIEYNLTDSSNNTTNHSLIIKNYDDVSPTLTIRNNIITDVLFDPYDYIQAIDNIEGDITTKVIVDKITKSDSGFIVTYEVSDLSGNYVRKTYEFYYHELVEKNNIIPIFPNYTANEKPDESVVTVNGKPLNYQNYVIGGSTIIVVFLIMLFIKKRK